MTVHGKTRACKFIGGVEYETIRRIKSSVSIPVIANGDIDSVGKAREVLDITGSDGVMIGRGALGSPWFPGSVAKYLETGKIVRAPSLEIQRKIVMSHLEELYSSYGDHRGVRIAKKHIKWYVDSFSDNLEFRKQFNSEEIAAKQIELVSDYFIERTDFLKDA